jgi:rhodanese-related sulfurtransferase
MSTGRLLAGIALLLGIAAAFAGSPHRDVRETDQVTALALAARIRDRQPGLRVIDIRPAPEFNAFQIPTAENISPEALDLVLAQSGQTIVVYADDAATANGAVTKLRSKGHLDVLALRGGVSAWIDDVMNPEHSTEVTRYFGGVARANGIRTLPRRGC